MPTEKPPSQTPHPNKDLISDDQDFWSRQFLKHIELNLLDVITGLPPSASQDEYQAATLQAVVETLLDSGMALDDFPSLVAKAIAKIEGKQSSTNATQWTSAMNARRMDLIDRQIQETITVQEQIELARLTEAMRMVVDSEKSQPMEGMKALHAKLLSVRDEEPGN
ncbi:MAG: hypothetical protein CMM00_16970 [Rhodopirellula sp.]|uniref:hypothetical protein n=1 Tax=Rhodopirellula TaxID=265488 RepID=UPI000C553775|nr:hypothetical protein [Rhodopirellula sp. UBA1907]MAP10379.1 hypothetical protein [Rhodopirellula sp.]|tara:strand:+ start:335 stop:832 length:498 start_codon:yes stop_codon:yes gene_type:complete